MPKRNLALYKTIGLVIEELRSKRYTSHGGKKACAEAFGTSPQVWGNWEKGRRIPSDENQVKLAEFFNITVAQLRGEEPLAEEPESTIARLGERVETLENELAACKAERDRLRDENRELIGANKLLKELLGPAASRPQAKPRFRK